MSRLELQLRAPRQYDLATWQQLLRDLEQQLNALGEERLAGKYGATTAAPTTGSWVQGDFVRNSAPVEAGAINNKYVIYGWRCVASGTPGTRLEQRALTGN